MTLSKEDIEKYYNIRINHFDVDESSGFKMLKIYFSNEWVDGGYAAYPLEKWGKECSDEDILNGLSHGIIAHSCRGKAEKTETPIMGDLLDYDRENHKGRCRDILENIERYISDLDLNDSWVEDKIRMEITSKFRGANGDEVNAIIKDLYKVDVSEIDPDFWDNMAFMYFDMAEENEHFLESSNVEGERMVESEELKEDPTISQPEDEMSVEDSEKKEEVTQFEEPETFNESKDTKYIVKIGKEEKEYDKKGEANSAFLKALSDNDSKTHCYLYKVDGKTRAVLGHDTGNKKLKESEELKEDPIISKPEDEMSVIDAEKKEEDTTFVEPNTFNESIFEESKKLEEAWFKDTGKDRDWVVCKYLHGRPQPVDENGELKHNAGAKAYESKKAAEEAKARFEADPANEGRRFIVTDNPDIINGVA